MKRRLDGPKGSWPLSIAVAGVVVALGAAGCGEADEAQPSQGSTAKAEEAVAAAEKRLDTLVKGTHRRPPSKGPAAQPNKKVWVVSCGEAVESCSFTASAVVDAGKTAGWDMTLVDSEFDASAAQRGIRQAIAAGANGIIIHALDCNLLRGALEEARRAEVEVVAFDAFDCDDPSVGGEALFSAENRLNFDEYSDAMISWGRDKAAWIVAETDGEAKAIEIRQQGSLVVDYIHEGFSEGIAQCDTCEILETVVLSDEDIVMGRVGEKVSSALLKHRDANAVHVPYDGLMTIGIETAIEESGRGDELAVMGGEGYEQNLDLIRSGRGQDAAVSSQQEWLAWSTVDILNRVFAGETELPDEGVGFQLIDREHNLPEKGGYEDPVDFKPAYRKLWGG